MYFSRLFVFSILVVFGGIKVNNIMVGKVEGILGEVYRGGDIRLGLVVRVSF